MTVTNVLPDVFDLSNRVILLTGSARGLGFAMAQHLARAGAHVVINGRDRGRAEAAVAQIAAGGGRASAAVFDVSDPESAAACVEAVAAEHGRLDGFVNNVGVRNRKSILDFELSELRAHIETNLVAAMWLARAAAKLMIPRRRGRIINISSIAARRMVIPDTAYGVAKGGLEAFTRQFAGELGPHGITVNAIAPGFFATETNIALLGKSELGQRLGARSAMQRWGKPDEVAGAAVYLCSDAASYVTGQTLYVDGGATATLF